ncbi:hypothetical protein PVBG_02936 [Plasmodium vivax Brazil I]|uniref:Pv-fam-d protein n=1 Tax=Plasmodium vivax (strain Brazil I) TaxID=1033975 RepID=A0A0J9T2Z2_PLAV1|nr:hypothetical protein PVBG_02936 [Plasmodium vivax Brazil I]
MISLTKLSIFSFVLCSWQYPNYVTELGTSWGNGTGQNDTLGVRISRSLRGETDVETRQNNILLREKIMGLLDGDDKKLFSRLNALINDETGGLEADDLSYQNFLKKRLGVAKYNDSSSSRSKSSSSRDSLKKKIKEMRDRDNLDKSEESLDLDNFDDEEEEVETSTNYGSMDSLFEERDDFEDEEEESPRMSESSRYRSKHRRSSSRRRMDIDDEIRYHMDKRRHESKFPVSRRGGFFKNSALGKMFKKIDSKIELEMLRFIKNRAQEERMGIKPKGFFNKFVFSMYRNKAFLPLVLALSVAYPLVLYYIGLNVAQYFGYMASWTMYPMAVPAAIGFAFLSMLLGGYYLKKGMQISNKILKFKNFSKGHKHKRSKKSRRI